MLGNRLAKEERYWAERELLFGTDAYNSGEWFSVADIAPQWDSRPWGMIRFSLNQFLEYGLLDKKTEGGHAVELFKRRDKSIVNGLWGG